MKWHREFVPKLVSVLREGITLKQLQDDLVAGVVVGIVALPLAIAFAIASGVSPEKGLITAIFAGFVISALGGSRVQIGGPTGAFIVIVYDIVQRYGVEGLTYATLIAGVLILVMGLLRLGAILRYIPHPLIVGFTSGIALIIFSSQMADFWGLSIPEGASGFLGKWGAYLSNMHTINVWSSAIGFATILIAIGLPKVTNKLPGSLAAIILCTAAVHIFQLPVETIASKFGEIPNAIPSPRLEQLSVEQIRSLLSPAFAIALLGGIESLLSAVVADGMLGSKHRSNMELVAQGVANIVSGLIGGIPATGAIARTATNIKNGGRTPIAGMVHSLTLLIIMVVAAPYAKLIPLACLSGILIVVAYNMSEWHNFISVFKGNPFDRLVLVTVFLLTVIFDLIIAIEIGMVLSAFLFVKRMSDMTQIKITSDISSEDEVIIKPPKGILIYDIRGSLFFGAAQTFQETLKSINQKPKAVILNFKNVPFIDATGLYRLKEVVRQFHQQGTLIYLSGLSPGVEVEVTKTGIPEWAAIGPSIDACLEQAKSKVNDPD